MRKGERGKMEEKGEEWERQKSREGEKIEEKGEEGLGQMRRQKRGKDKREGRRVGKIEEQGEEGKRQKSIHYQQYKLSTKQLPFTSSMCKVLSIIQIPISPKFPCHPKFFPNYSTIADLRIRKFIYPCEQDSWDIGQFYNANHLKYIVNSGQPPKNENIVEFQVGVEMFSKLKRQTNKPITSAL